MTYHIISVSFRKYNVYITLSDFAAKYETFISLWLLQSCNSIANSAKIKTSWIKVLYFRKENEIVKIIRSVNLS